MKLSIITLVLFSSFAYSFHPQEIREAGLNPKNENQLALYAFLYEIALKNKLSGGKLLGTEVCFDYDTSKEGFNLTVGLANTSFERGEFNFTDKSSSEYKKMSEVINMTDNFFKTAKNKITGKKEYSPKLTISGYADPVYNDDQSFSLNHSSLNKVKNKDSIKTDSQKRNQVLATLRAESVAKTFFNNRDYTAQGFNSHSLDSLSKEPKNKDDYACSSRRRVTIKYDVDPSISFDQPPKVYSPRFNTSKGKKQSQMVAATVLDAGSYESLDSLSPECQGKSVQVFHEQAKAITGLIKNNINRSKSKIKELVKEMNSFCMSRSDDSLCDEKALKNLSRNQFSEDKDNYGLISYLSGLDKNAFRSTSRNYKLQKLLKENQRIISLSRCASLNKVKCSAEDWASSGLKAKLDDKTYKFYIGHKFSSHFTGCFSNQAFYVEHFDDYIRSPGELRDKKTGMMTVSYTENDIPSVSLKDRNGDKKVVDVAGKAQFSDFKGHGCSASGHGSHYNHNTKRFDVYQRADNADHINDMRFATKDSSGKRNTRSVVDEAVAITEHFQGDTRSPGSMKMAEHMTPVMYIIKDCDPKNFSTAKMIRMRQFNSQGEFNKKIKIGENDCTFEPDIVSTCNAVPEGENDNGEGVAGDKMLIYSFLNGKALEVSLEGGLNSFIDEVNKSIVNQCGNELDPGLKSENLIETIKCGSSKNPPLPTNDAKKDCPSVPRAEVSKT